MHNKGELLLLPGYAIMKSGSLSFTFSLIFSVLNHVAIFHDETFFLYFLPLSLTLYFYSHLSLYLSPNHKKLWTFSLMG
eukprot:c7607_g1_i1 orf=84-320(+)